MPRVSVIIPTRDRPVDLRRCLDSLAVVSYPDWEILVVDQSADSRTRALATQYGVRLPFLRYLQTKGAGSARARNHAMPLTTGDLVAFVDDDCTVDADWLWRVAQTFARHPNAALVFGEVRGAEVDPRDYLVPAYEIPAERILKGRLTFLRTRCMAASMYLRPQAWREVGPMDVLTGAGARFAGEDRDYCYRVLASGRQVVETPAISVMHHGARPYHTGAAARLLRRAAYSDGALHMKLLRSGELSAVVVIAVELCRAVGLIRMRNLVRGRRPTGLAWIVMYVCGLLGSFRYPVDRRRCLWIDTPGQELGSRPI